MKNLDPLRKCFGKSARPPKEKKEEFKIVFETTSRGFRLGKFIDLYGRQCSIQESSLATDDAIWLGVDNANPQILASDAEKLGLPTEEKTGWIDYPHFPAQVVFTTRMHLNKEQAKVLIKILRNFVKNGTLRK